MNSHNAHTHAALYTRISYKDLQLFHLHHSQADTLIISSSPAAPPSLSLKHRFILKRPKATVAERVHRRQEPPVQVGVSELGALLPSAPDAAPPSLLVSQQFTKPELMRTQRTRPPASITSITAVLKIDRLAPPISVFQSATFTSYN